MADTEMIERVAQAMARVDTEVATYEDLARAAIAAAREPTAAMIMAAAEHKGQMSYSEVWRVMLDEALKSDG